MTAAVGGTSGDARFRRLRWRLTLGRSCQVRTDILSGRRQRFDTIVSDASCFATRLSAKGRDRWEPSFDAWTAMINGLYSGASAMQTLAKHQ
ncbi:MAG: hypothetical protein AAGJ83_16270, partial [Planctomycetota bacterium]